MQNVHTQYKDRAKKVFECHRNALKDEDGFNRGIKRKQTKTLLKLLMCRSTADNIAETITHTTGEGFNQTLPSKRG